MDVTTEQIKEAITILQGIVDKSHRSDSESLSGSLAGDTKESSGKPRERILVLAVGHSRIGDSGAVSYDKKSYEWSYNFQLAYKIETFLPTHIKTHVITGYNGSNYREAMSWLKETVDPLNADLVCELHFNSSSNQEANGYEMLHWHSSKKGKEAANNLITQMHKDYPERTNRRAKGVLEGGRGAGFLKGLKAPCVILEPFFGSNKEEWEFFGAGKGVDDLARTLAKGISVTLS